MTVSELRRALDNCSPDDQVLFEHHYAPEKEYREIEVFDSPGEFHISLEEKL